MIKCVKWSVQICGGDNASGSGRPDEIDSNQIKTLSKNHLHHLGYFCFDGWAPIS